MTIKVGQNELSQNYRQVDYPTGRIPAAIMAKNLSKLLKFVISISGYEPYAWQPDDG